MAKIIIILGVVSICAALCFARLNGSIPEAFYAYDKEYLLSPVNEERLGNNRVVFKFGNAEQRKWPVGAINYFQYIISIFDFMFVNWMCIGGEVLQTLEDSDEWDTPVKVNVEHGYSKDFLMGNVKEAVVYVEIEIESVWNISCVVSSIAWKSLPHKFIRIVCLYLVFQSNRTMINQQPSSSTGEIHDTRTNAATSCAV